MQDCDSQREDRNMTSRFGNARTSTTREARAVTVTLPDDAKVSGAFTMHYTDEAHAAVYTDGAHVNDDNLAINYRGESFLARIDVFKLADGSISMTPPSGNVSRASVTRRSNWSDAPPSYARAIEEAMAHAAIASWDDDVAHEAQVWRDEIDASRLRRDIEEASSKLSALRKELRTIERRYADES